MKKELRICRRQNEHTPFTRWKVKGKCADSVPGGTAAGCVIFYHRKRGKTSRKCELIPNIHLGPAWVQFSQVVAHAMKKNEPLLFDEDIYNTIRRNIKKYRKEKGMTSAQLAELVDLSHDFVRQIESERVGHNFSVETFYKISVALGVSMDKLARK